MKTGKTSSRGVTIIELLIAMAIVGLIWLVVAALVRQSLGAPRFQLQQGGLATTVRVQVGRMRDVIREGRVTSVSSNSITVDYEGQTITYQLSGTTLRRTTSSGTTTVARGVENQAEGINLFRYFSIGAERALELDLTATSFDLSFVDQVLISLVLADNGTGSDPTSDALVRTNVWLRELP